MLWFFRILQFVCMIGILQFVCMIRTPDRYKSKIVDLKDMIEKSLIAMDKVSLS
jgi:ABC-type transport system involved in cytochrome c biogenesis permease subunit